MEKTARAVMVPLDARWSDVGSWRALLECSAKYIPLAPEDASF